MPSISSCSKFGTPPMNELTNVFEIGFTPFSAWRVSTSRVPASVGCSS